MGTGRLKHKPWMANERTMAMHTRILGEIFKDEYDDNTTYGLNDFEKQNFRDGYQVTFVRGGDNYTPTEYANIVNAFLDKVPDHKASITKYNGYPEITFHIPKIRSALWLARKYGQTAIWDWMNDEEVEINSRRH